ncbi:integrase catalytic domain-containing protein, partial [Trichonephila clavipes]
MFGLAVFGLAGLYCTKYFERTSHSYPQSNRRVQGHSRFHPSHKSFSANELLTAANSNCLFCFENTHMSDLCENLCVQKKRAKLIKEGRCFICCNTGCYVKKCKKEVCSYCKGRHARAICFKLEKSKQNSHLDLEEKNVDVKTTSSNSVFHNRGGILLQCVEAEIIGRSSSDKIFCLFDNGSSDFYWSLTHRIKRLDSADQLSGQLPRDRITQSPPFQSVGIDFTVTRAVHLELVSDMSTKCFYLLFYGDSLARRGNCKVIYSDNARTFKAAERELTYFANILKDSEFQSFVADKGIHWKFIVERVPWWSGFYERLVKTIKDPLRKILGRALLTFEELSTILSEVEVIVNHRPLTYVENDPGEPEPLTPAHFLELGYGDSKYPIHFIELIDATTAKESYKKKERLTELFFFKNNFGDA